MNTCLGIELGSTRIKAVTIDEGFKPVSSGDYTWASRYENGVWTYPLEEVWTGLKAALSQVENRDGIAAAGVSAMMHGYLAFDKDWKLLTPFRVTGETLERTGNPRVLYLHCLPSFHDFETKLAKEWKEKGVDIREVTDEVFRGPHSVVFDEAENRMHSIKAVLAATIGC